MGCPGRCATPSQGRCAPQSPSRCALLSPSKLAPPSQSKFATPSPKKSAIPSRRQCATLCPSRPVNLSTDKLAWMSPGKCAGLCPTRLPERFARMLLTQLTVNMSPPTSNCTTGTRVGKTLNLQALIYLSVSNNLLYILTPSNKMLKLALVNDAIFGTKIEQTFQNTEHFCYS